MKPLIQLTALSLLVAGSTIAGPINPKLSAAAPVPETYGVGWYGAIQAGLNAHQDLPTFDPYALIWNDSGSGSPDAAANSDVGGAAGFKLGYTFNPGKIRPAVEADVFYNGFGYDYQGRDNIRYDDLDAKGAVAGHVNSVVYMANFLVRYDLGRFQPYVGFGLGGYFAESTVNSMASWDLWGLDKTRYNRDNTSWAWQVLAGADYYFTPTVSAFVEYKWLNYENFSMFNGNPKVDDSEILPKSKDDIGQHLIMLGIRIGLGAPSPSEAARVATCGKDGKQAIETAETYGLGWYGALDAGINLHQQLPTFDPSVLADEDDPGTASNADRRSDVGGIGGAKFGYVFNTGKLRPAIEGDVFYNSFGYSYQGVSDDVYGVAAGHVQSFAYMTNFLLRYDAGRLQPYIGVGIGGYYAQSRVSSLGSYELSDELNSSFNQNSSSWAWQLIGGADYYFTKSMSAFVEYKWLNYENFTMFNSGPTYYSNSILPKTTSDIGQHLVTLGVRFHF